VTDRDPTNPAELATLVALLADASDVATDAEHLERVAERLLDALLSQGCLTPEEHAGAYLEEPPVPGYLLASVRVAGLGWLQVDGSGNVAVVPEE
jgi:hypothetical protein